jgi:hypothetical protein
VVDFVRSQPAVPRQRLGIINDPKWSTSARESTDSEAGQDATAAGASRSGCHAGQDATAAGYRAATGAVSGPADSERLGERWRIGRRPVAGGLPRRRPPSESGPRPLLKFSDDSDAMTRACTRAEKLHDSDFCKRENTPCRWEGAPLGPRPASRDFVTAVGSGGERTTGGGPRLGSGRIWRGRCVGRMSLGRTRIPADSNSVRLCGARARGGRRACLCGFGRKCLCEFGRKCLCGFGRKCLCGFGRNVCGRKGRRSSY